MNLSTEPIAKEPRTRIKNELKINSLMINSLPNEPVTMSAIAKNDIIKNAEKPTIDFSLIVLLSSKSCLKKFFIMISV